MSRFLRLERPVAAPYFDITTRDTTVRDVFDLGVDLEGYDGSVFIKVTDIQEMARTIGMLSAEDAKLITDENKRLQAMVDKLPAETEVLKNELDRVVSNFHNSLTSVGDSSNAENEPEEHKRDSEEPKQDDGPDLLDLLKSGE